MSPLERDNWRLGSQQVDYYQRSLAEVTEWAQRRRSLPDVVPSEQMGWEDSPQGRLKHLLNGYMDTKARSIDLYIQEIPPGGRSGKHRHMGEEMLVVLEGRGYDLHWDPLPEFGDHFRWRVATDPMRYEWDEGDVILIPVNTAHQHVNLAPARPVRLLSATARVCKYLGYHDLEQLEHASPG